MLGKQRDSTQVQVVLQRWKYNAKERQDSQATVSPGSSRLGLLPTLHPLSQNLDLPLNLNPQGQAGKLVVAGCGQDPTILILVGVRVGAPVAITSNSEEGRYERFLDVSKAEIVGDVGNCVAELVRKLNVVVVG